jgi:RNA polymerase sigma-70 factor (ECF subfamily)
MQDETTLIEAISSLDQVALEAVFEEYAPALYKYLLRLGQGPQEADQIVGDVFVRLLEKLSEGKGPKKNLRSYLFQTAYHLVVDHSRDRKRAAPLEVTEIEPDTVKKETTSVQAQTEEALLLETLSSAIESELTEEQRIVIVLRFQEGFNLKETAEIVGKKVNAVKALQNRAMNRLRAALTSDESEDQDA